MSAKDYIKILRGGVTVARATVSALISNPLTGDELQTRLDICAACDQFSPSPEGFGHCNGCSCSKNKHSDLSVKATIRYPTCPKSKWPILSPLSPIYEPGAAPDAHPSPPEE